MIVKRYPNRKLYDTANKCYITLDGLADLIRQGEAIQVVDHASGEDLTAHTLSQVIADQEKRRGGFVPHPVLAGLVQAGGDTLDAMRRAMVSPLDLIRHVDDEIARRVETLVSDEQMPADEGMRLLDKLLAAGAHCRFSPATIQQIVERVLDERGVPSRDDFQRLETMVDDLAEKIDALL